VPTPLNTETCPMCPRVTPCPCPHAVAWCDPPHDTHALVFCLFFTPGTGHWRALLLTFFLIGCIVSPLQFTVS
jgi:hypothetical protein